jgi:hypothetical protein
MVHGSEVVLPRDIDYGSPRVKACTEEGNQVALEDAIYQLDEARDVALLVVPSTNKLYDATTSATCTLASSTSETWSSDEFKAARTDTSSHPPWEGSFIVHQVLRPGTYKIRYEDS